MLFHVTISVRMPHEVDPNRVKQLRERERETCGRIATAGEMAASVALGRQKGECEYF